MMEGDDSSSREERMGAKSEALAKQYETKVQEATAVMEGISEADWKKTTAAEQWTVGVVAHHVAGGHEGIAGIIKTVAGGQSIPNFTLDALHEMNAKHAHEFANVGKADTIALHKKNAATAAAVVRGLSDADLDRSGTVLSGLPAMSVEQIVTNILINHVDEHVKNIRGAVGK
jgi:hypothetical protein